MREKLEENSVPGLVTEAGEGERDVIGELFGDINGGVFVLERDEEAIGEEEKKRTKEIVEAPLIEEK